LCNDSSSIWNIGNFKIFCYNLLNVALIVNIRFNMNRAELITKVVELDSQVQRVVRRRSAATWMNLNLTVPQVKTLFFVSNQPGTNPTSIAAALGVTPPNVTGIVDRLVEQGLLIRRGNDEDRRALILQTTEKADSILSGLRGRRTDVLRKLYDYLEERDLSQLAESLSKLVEAARAYEENNVAENDRG
jgi:DNA-binding MarR family transcriptional regulator